MIILWNARSSDEKRKQQHFSGPWKWCSTGVGQSFAEPSNFFHLPDLPILQPILSVVKVALGALHMDYNPATSCISSKQDASAAKTLHLKNATICFCCFGADTCLFAPHCSFLLFSFNLNPSYLTD